MQDEVAGVAAEHTVPFVEALWLDADRCPCVLIASGSEPAAQVRRVRQTRENVVFAIMRRPGLGGLASVCLGEDLARGFHE